MDRIADHRRRLATLTVERVERIAAPAEALAACRATRDRLRDLKREVLTELTDLRAEVSRLGKKAKQGAPTLREAWKRRDEGRGSCYGTSRNGHRLLDGDEGKALESWSQINREIDSRLERLAELEPRLARAVVGDRPLTLPGQHEAPAASEKTDDDVYATAGAATRPAEEPAKPEQAMSDEAYAAVGAAVRKGERHDAYCPHCGTGVESADRFCRKCGHRLG